MEKKHPIQPLITGDDGVVRFQSNQIVKFLLEKGGFNLNDLDCIDFPKADREQFAQLIGYSLSAYGGLACVSRESYDAAESMFSNPEQQELEARYNAVCQQLDEVRRHLRSAASVAFNIHPDNLSSDE